MVGWGQFLLKEGSVKNHSINKVLLEGDVGVVNRNNLEIVNY